MHLINGNCFVTKTNIANSHYGADMPDGDLSNFYPRNFTARQLGTCQKKAKPIIYR